MSEWVQVIGAIGGILSGICLSALLIYNFRVLHTKVDNKAKDLHTRVDSKMDKSACIAQHEAIQKDFKRGEKSFDGLRKDIRGLNKEISDLNKSQSETNTLLARLDERIVQYMQQAAPNPAPTIPAVTHPNQAQGTKN